MEIGKKYTGTYDYMVIDQQVLPRKTGGVMYLLQVHFPACHAVASVFSDRPASEVEGLEVSVFKGAVGLRAGKVPEDEKKSK